MTLMQQVQQIIERRNRPLYRSDILDALEKREGYRREKISGILNNLYGQGRIRKKFDKKENLYVFSSKK